MAVSPDNPSSPYHISLSNDKETFGINLKGGARGMQEVPATPSTRQFTQGGGKYGDWEPGFSHVPQRDWSGGRGQEDFAEDATRFFDSKECWTLTPGFIMPAPLWNVCGVGVVMDIGSLSYATLDAT